MSFKNSEDDSETDDPDWFLQMQREITAPHLSPECQKLCFTVFGIPNLTDLIISFAAHPLLPVIRKVNFALLTQSDQELRRRSSSVLYTRSGVPSKYNIEQALFEWSLSTVPASASRSRCLGLSPRARQRYCSKLRSLISNFADIKNDLKQRVIQQTISASSLVRMTPLEMASKKVRTARAQVKAESKQGRLLTSKQRHAKGFKTDRFMCATCGSMEATYKTRPSSLNSKERYAVLWLFSVHCFNTDIFLFLLLSFIIFQIIFFF